LVVGPAGSGKRTVAQTLAERVLQIAELNSYPYQRLVTAENGSSIGIEAVRELEKFVSLKVPGDKTYNRVIIIEDAHLLTLEAQNALLKTLEEPPTGTLVMLTASHEQALLPTIRSRAQKLVVNRPERVAVEDYFAEYEPESVRRAYAISGGLPGLMRALLDESEHPLRLATERARQLLSQPAYERLLSVDELSKQRELAVNICFILQQMAHVSLQTASGAAAKKWQTILRVAYQASESLANSAQPKLVLTNLMLNL
jgi:hypothetical protein